MKIPYLSFHYQTALLRDTLQQTFSRVLDSGWYIMGRELESFEKAYSEFNHTAFTIGVANGLDALVISLRVLGVGSNDEVIVPSNTYIATLLAVTELGARPVLVEPIENTFNIDPARIEEKITSKTRAIIPVHLYGQTCDMDSIMNLAKKHNLFVVEDNAQAHGASWNGKLAGSFGHLNATSFYPGKNFGAFGDGGGITTDNEEYYRTAKRLRNYGSDIKYYNQDKGYNSRLDELQAAFLKDKLSYLQQFTSERITLAANYQNLLAGVGDLQLPQTDKSATHVYHVYCIRTLYRSELMNYLDQNGIGTLIHYPVPPHLQEAYHDLGYKKGAFPIAESISETCMSLPLYPGLTEAEQLYIAQKIKDFFNSHL